MREYTVVYTAASGGMGERNALPTIDALADASMEIRVEKVRVDGDLPTANKCRGGGQRARNERLWQTAPPTVRIRGDWGLCWKHI